MVLVIGDSDEEYLDDPIKLIDCEQKRIKVTSASVQESIELSDSDDDIISLPSSKANEVAKSLKPARPTCKTVSPTFPVGFFETSRNTELLHKCLPLRIDIVDCDKYPWYYRRKYKNIKLEKLKLDVTNSSNEKIKKRRNSTKVTVDDETMKRKIYPVNVESYMKSPIRDMKTAMRKNNESLNKVALKDSDEKNVLFRNIDYKKNQGLVGLKIVYDVNVKDSNTKIEDKKQLNEAKIPKYDSHTRKKSINIEINRSPKTNQEKTGIEPYPALLDTYDSESSKKNNLEEKNKQLHGETLKLQNTLEVAKEKICNVKRSNQAQIAVVSKKNITKKKSFDRKTKQKVFGTEKKLKKKVSEYSTSEENKRSNNKETLNTASQKNEMRLVHNKKDKMKQKVSESKSAMSQSLEKEVISVCENSQKNSVEHDNDVNTKTPSNNIAKVCEKDTLGKRKIPTLQKNIEQRQDNPKKYEKGTSKDQLPLSIDRVSTGINRQTIQNKPLSSANKEVKNDTKLDVHNHLPVPSIIRPQTERGFVITDINDRKIDMSSPSSPQNPGGRKHIKQSNPKEMLCSIDPPSNNKHFKKPYAISNPKSQFVGFNEGNANDELANNSSDIKSQIPLTSKIANSQYSVKSILQIPVVSKQQEKSELQQKKALFKPEGQFADLNEKNADNKMANNSFHIGSQMPLSKAANIQSSVKSIPKIPVLNEQEEKSELVQKKSLSKQQFSSSEHLPNKQMIAPNKKLVIYPFSRFYTRAEDNRTITSQAAQEKRLMSNETLVSSHNSLSTRTHTIPTSIHQMLPGLDASLVRYQIASQNGSIPKELQISASQTKMVSKPPPNKKITPNILNHARILIKRPNSEPNCAPGQQLAAKQYGRGKDSPKKILNLIPTITSTQKNRYVILNKKFIDKNISEREQLTNFETFNNRERLHQHTMPKQGNTLVQNEALTQHLVPGVSSNKNQEVSKEHSTKKRSLLNPAPLPSQQPNSYPQNQLHKQNSRQYPNAQLAKPIFSAHNHNALQTPLPNLSPYPKQHLPYYIDNNGHAQYYNDNSLLNTHQVPLSNQQPKQYEYGSYYNNNNTMQNTEQAPLLAQPNEYESYFNHTTLVNSYQSSTYHQQKPNEQGSYTNENVILNLDTNTLTQPPLYDYVHQNVNNVDCAYWNGVNYLSDEGKQGYPPPTEPPPSGFPQYLTLPPEYNKHTSQFPYPQHLSPLTTMEPLQPPMASHFPPPAQVPQYPQSTPVFQNPPPPVANHYPQSSLFNQRIPPPVLQHLPPPVPKHPPPPVPQHPPPSVPQHPTPPVPQHPPPPVSQHPSLPVLQHPSLPVPQHPPPSNSQNLPNSPLQILQHPPSPVRQHSPTPVLQQSSLTDSQHSPAPVPQHPPPTVPQHPPTTVPQHPPTTVPKHPPPTVSQHPPPPVLQHPPPTAPKHPPPPVPQHPPPSVPQHPPPPVPQHPPPPAPQQLIPPMPDSSNYLQATVTQGSTILGANNNGVVRTINLTTTAPKVVTSNNSSTGDNNIPINTKSDMLQELSKSMDMETPNLKRCISDSHKDLSKVPNRTPPFGTLAKVRKMEVHANDPSSTPKALNYGYSPPILPIPTYEKTFEYIAQFTGSTEKTTSNRTDSIVDNYNGMKIRGILKKKPDLEGCVDGDKREKPVKKISIDEYKNRDKGDPKPDVEYAVKTEIKTESKLDDTDLGYDSDSTVIL